jgi:hypothetical protein
MASGFGFNGLAPGTIRHHTQGLEVAGDILESYNFMDVPHRFFSAFRFIYGFDGIAETEE